MLDPAARRELAFYEAGLSDSLRENRVDPARRDRLIADAARLKPGELPALYGFLSEWEAGALKQAVAAVDRLTAGATGQSGGPE